ncbi:hypothetical protein SAMN05421678_106258 [Actinopolymorpha cephalotaxi]|uniref:Uncharacterized protein n=1 Tax=Actinopolymorpha cephalotaxi TaxID=504797 RepID=A0A1I2SNC0_9ACTN|nr:hypothetical protein [Actinopolymorpha cephalotaxi]SFG53209.1 hypothetical protein SAMN05421678_106258 [Actinopolymorpha cephalotaxi]
MRQFLFLGAIAGPIWTAWPLDLPWRPEYMGFNGASLLSVGVALVAIAAVIKWITGLAANRGAIRGSLEVLSFIGMIGAGLAIGGLGATLIAFFRQDGAVSAGFLALAVGGFLTQFLLGRQAEKILAVIGAHARMMEAKVGPYSEAALMEETRRFLKESGYKTTEDDGPADTRAVGPLS